MFPSVAWSACSGVLKRASAVALFATWLPTIALAGPVGDFRPIDGIDALAAGELHTCILRDGGVLCTGVNEHGQLGRDDVFSAVTPAEVGGLPTQMVAATAGGRHSCALAVGGEVWCWGDNTSGQAGRGTSEARATPAPISGLSASRIDAGESHGCAVATSGGASCWGLNADGQLGDGSVESRHSPVTVEGLTVGVRDVAAGYDHSCALLDDGTVRCWGAGDRGQLGHGAFSDSLSPVVVSGLADATAIATGEGFSCALRSGGVVSCWGDGRHGLTGGGSAVNVAMPIVANLDTPSVSISAGRSHACAAAVDATVRCWGLDSTAQLGASGSNEFPRQPVLVRRGTGEVLENVLAISAGGDHTCALSSGRGVCWGLNSEGQQGYGRALRRRDAVVPTGLTAGIVSITTAYDYACAITSSHQLRCWGLLNWSGSHSSFTQAPIAFPDFGAPLAISAAEWHLCAIDAGGGVLCMGDNTEGNLGNGTTVSTTTPVRVFGLDHDIRSITTRGVMNCALSNVGAVKCWGNRRAGVTTDALAPTTVDGLPEAVDALVGGYNFACALREGTVYCWGNNEYGQLGDGTGVTRAAAAPVPGLELAVAITAQDGHACALSAAGALSCWGANPRGQVGDGSTQAVLAPVVVKGLPADIASIHAGNDVTCAITSDGATWCWGGNIGSELADGTRRRAPAPVRARALLEPMDSIDTGWWFGCGKTRAGHARCWGENRYATLGNTGYASLATVFMAPMSRYIGPQGVFRDTFEWRQ